MTDKQAVDPADGLPVLEVGPWTAEKHDYLRRYIEATRAARARYLPPAGPGGAAFIDLFAGPGRALVRGRWEIIDGSPLIAAHHAEAPFTKVLLCELDPNNAAALRQRLSGDARVQVFEGDCNIEIDSLTAQIPPDGLNLALIDPFGVTPLRFETLAKLATFRRMDLLLHFPTNDLVRNVLRHPDRVTAFLGTEDWRKQVTGPRDVHKLREVFRERLQPFGYRATDIRHEPLLRNTKRAPLYHLVLVAKHDLADSIWNSVIRTEGSGQKRFGWS
jgi:three-Cys-motif partner protein